MPALVSIALLPCALVGAGAESYQTALREAETNQRPLVVLVGADWCPGCRTMKQGVLPALARRGALRNVSMATVDADREASLAGQLMRGSSIPQLIVFSRGQDGNWRREQITGAASEARVESLITRAIAE
jgi:thioredoxin-like negative regulator of GroEL